jgi:hypothetical protein
MKLRTPAMSCSSEGGGNCVAKYDSAEKTVEFEVFWDVIIGVDKMASDIPEAFELAFESSCRFVTYYPITELLI